MTIDEAKDICKKLTDINLKIWLTSDHMHKMSLKTKFKEELQKVTAAGFKIKYWIAANGDPMFEPKATRHFDDVCIATNKPDGLNIKSDCTTRCISFCTGVDYMTIRAEQLSNARNASECWATWRHNIVWKKSLLSRGFVEIMLDKRHVSRSTFIRLSKTLRINSGCIATVSSHHVAAIDMASRKILDSWNSSGGRIIKIYVPESQANEYRNWLIDIGCANAA